MIATAGRMQFETTGPFVPPPSYGGQTLVRRANRRRSLQRTDEGLEAGGDFGGRGVWGEGDGSAEVDGDFVEMGQAATFLLHLPDTVQAHGDDGDGEILGEQADAGLEGDHGGSVAIVDDAFGEDEEAVTAIGGLASVAETFAKAGELRERVDVEERDD